MQAVPNLMASTAVDNVLAKLTGIRTAGSGHMAKCPAHEDHVQSLHIDTGDDGRVLLHCHAGCATSAVTAALGLRLIDLFPQTEVGNGRQPVSTFDYTDADGILKYQVCRFFPKEFRQRRPDGAGGWIWKIPNTIRRVPYRLPQLRNVATVYIVEGEKDADRLWALGIPATTNAGGASKWGAGETKALVDAGVQRVIILPDNDQPGLKHAEHVATLARQKALAVTIICLPDLPEHGDVSDWLAAGHTVADLQALVSGTPYVLPAQAVAPTSALTAAAEALEATLTPRSVMMLDAMISGGPHDDWPQLDATAYHMTDLGAAESFRDRCTGGVRYDHEQQHWLVWDGHYWKPDADEMAYRLAHDHVRRLQQEALAAADYTIRQQAVAFALKCEKRSGIENMLAMARSLKPLSSAGGMWDANGMQLGCLNGVVDLTTGELHEGSRDDFITQRVGTFYDPAAECPRWLQFMREVFDDNDAVVDYVHRAIGYSLTADMREQCFFVAFGTGSNGKSKFLDTLESVFGSYAHRADMRIFAATAADGGSEFHLADFQSRRLIFATEVKKGSRMNEHVIKSFTGGERMRVAKKFGHPFTIQPVGKIWLGVNHRPKVVDDSYGFWRRVRLIPFLRTFAGSADDRGLREKLLAEAAGILSWAVQGCLAWQAGGLQEPPSVLAETEMYRQDEDPLTEFFDTRTEVEVGRIAPFATINGAYREWAMALGLSERDKMSPKALAAAVAARGFERIKVNNTVCYKGIRIVAATGFDFDTES